MPAVPALAATRWLKLSTLLLCLLPAAWIIAGVAGAPWAPLSPNPVEDILHRLGEWSLNFLVATLAISPASELTGRREWLAIRRMLGLTAFSYALGHFVWYLGVDQGLELTALARDVVKRPYITAGFAALLLLLPLAVTSTKRWMRRLGRRWQTLHRLAYVAAGLGVLHYLWLVKADLTTPLAYGLVLGLLLIWRIPAVRRLARNGPPAGSRP
ncbi:MAG: sulfite oxidase heme-binding subunit YedZ [Steroidobacteraceae bacterium]